MAKGMSVIIGDTGCTELSKTDGTGQSGVATGSPGSPLLDGQSELPFIQSAVSL